MPKNFISCYHISPKRSLLKVFLIIVLAASFASVSTISETREFSVDYEKTVLVSGATLVYNYKPESSLTNVQIRVLSGLSNEGKYAGTGISHFLEHLLFKKTKNKTSEEIRKEIKKMGGVVNGSTGLDSAEYHITVPNEKFKQALFLLADMIVNPAFDDKEIESERQVVLRELKMRMDDPLSKRIKLLFSDAYKKHVYKYPIIGEEEKFIRLSREDLATYHASTYIPENMVIGVAGGVKFYEVLDAAKAVFGKSEKEAQPSGEIESEPEQRGERIAVYKEDSILGYMVIGFHTTSLYSSDMYPVDVLSIVAGEGNDSRLYKHLVKDNRLLYSVSSSNYTPKYPGLFIVTGIGSPENLEEAREEVFRILDGFKEGLIGKPDIDRAKNLVISAYLHEHEDIERVVNTMTSFELMLGEPAFFEEYIDRIKEVKPEDVQRAASKFLSRESSTTVFLVPDESVLTYQKTSLPVLEGGQVQPLSQQEGTKDEISEELPSPTGRGRSRRRYLHKGRATSRESHHENKILRPKEKNFTLENGLNIIIKEKGAIPLIAVTFSSYGGLRAENAANNGISSFSTSLLLKGTENRSEGEIVPALEKMGGSISTFSGMNSVGLGMDVFTEDLEEGLDVFEDVLKNAVFSQDEIDKQKEKFVAIIEEEEKDIFGNGMNVLRKILFGDHPYAMKATGEVRTINNVHRPDIKAFYRQHFVPKDSTITVVGKVDVEESAKSLEKRFSTWEGQRGTQESKEVKLPEGPGRKDVYMNKEQSLLVCGFLGINVEDRRKYALDIISALLSGSDGILFFATREEDNIAYTSGAANIPGVAGAGYFLLYLATTEDEVEKAEKIVLSSIEKITSGRISDEDIESSKYRLISQHAHSLETNTSLSMTMALGKLYGLGADHYKEYPERIKAVTKEEIMACARELLNPQKAFIVIVHSSKE